MGVGGNGPPNSAGPSAGAGAGSGVFDEVRVGDEDVVALGEVGSYSSSGAGGSAAGVEDVVV